jgi:hypothetical protein
MLCNDKTHEILTAKIYMSMTQFSLEIGIRGLRIPLEQGICPCESNEARKLLD